MLPPPQDFMVISLSFKAARSLEVQRMVGMIIGVARGVIPLQYLQHSLREDITVRVPTAPASHLFLADMCYDKYCGKHEVRHPHSLQSAVCVVNCLSWTHQLRCSHWASHKQRPG